MMYSGDEEFGDEITSGIFPEDHYDGPDYDPELENDGEFYGETR